MAISVSRTFQAIPRFLWILLLITLVGMFFRTYHFHDWLRFNADQSRDATVVSEYIEGKAPLPLLGPKAGGTDFRLGPAFYYFQIVVAQLLGNAPDRIAYPDLLFSILAIPLLFFFLRKYFDVRVALLLVALFAVSAYAVKYSRFAWNPNSLPFWSLLFLSALHEIASAKERVLMRWPVLAGVAIGVGVQLHTLTLILFPLVTLSVLGFLWYRKKEIWRTFSVVFLVAVFLNGAMVVSEFQTGGANTKAFLHSVGTKEKKGSGLVANVAKDTICFVEGNDYVLSSYDASDNCEVKGLLKGRHAVVFLAGLLFFLGGIGLGIRFLRKEQDEGRRSFLGIFILYLVLYFVLLIPLANEISMRFFLSILFMPFVLLGFWLSSLAEKYQRWGIYGASAVVLLLMAANLVSLRNTFSDSASYLRSSDAGMDNVLLAEVERSASFVLVHADGAEAVVVHGDGAYLFKALKSMQYFTERSGITLVQKKRADDPGVPVFLVDNTKSKAKILAENPGITEYETFGRFTIFKEQ